MSGMFPLALTKLIQFQLGCPTLHIHLSPIVPVTTFLAFQPDIFSFIGSRHNNKTSLKKHSDLSAVKTVQKGLKKVPCTWHGTLWFKLKFTQ
jgi:hypothetical protein